MLGTQVVMLWAICEEGVQSGGAFPRQLVVSTREVMA